MSPNEIKHIIDVVVEYGWPFQRYYISGNDGKLWKTEENNQSIFTLLKMLSVQAPVRLDPDHVWDWPIETREGMPVWVRQLYDDEWSEWGQGVVFSDGQVYLLRDEGGVSEYVPSWDKTDIGHEIQTCAPHPLNPTMEPPADWVADGKRILK